MTMCADCNHPEGSVFQDCDCGCHPKELTAHDLAGLVFTMRKVKTPEGLITGATVNFKGYQFHYGDGRVSEWMQDNQKVKIL